MSERTNLAVAVSDNGKDFTQVLFPEPIDEVWFYPQGFIDDKADKYVVRIGIQVYNEPDGFPRWRVSQQNISINCSLSNHTLRRKC